LSSDEKKNVLLSNSADLNKQDVNPFKVGDPAPPPSSEELANKSERTLEDLVKPLQEKRDENKPSGGVSLAKLKFNALISRTL
jgi:hypothetical protein